ncbi:hypothetical protein [Dysgonomonas sp. GY617]|uniref:hypothetical protein n=1 Tax=Dysgonomonas sp. GY617 TaxID=2780420 RepID=UPI001884669F|nr:hypothetical protein [Dysgonomonas sp. GY617]MBF0578195.1 hypothetical protein [Dysgonomonas sp. GY617]
MKRKFVITLTLIYNHTIEVEADNSNEAITYVNDNKDLLAPDSDFTKGEKTVDFAEPVEN